MKVEYRQRVLWRLHLAGRPTLLLTLFLACSPSVHGEKGWKTSDPVVECAAAKDRSLCEELLLLRDRDQLARYAALAQPDDESLEAEVARVDQENLARLETIIADHGWPGRSMVGLKASGGAWTVIQHASLEVQQKYLPAMKEAANTGELEWGLLATTIDRIRVGQGQLQVYGTQFHLVDGELVPYPIENPETVDQRRLEVGLGTISDYEAQLRAVYKRQQE